MGRWAQRRAGLTAWLGLLVAVGGCSRTSTERLARSSEVTEISAVQVNADDSILVFGAHEPGYQRLYEKRARILRYDPATKALAIVHDGEGNVIDAARASEAVRYGLVRRVSSGDDGVARQFWLLKSTDAGATFTRVAIPQRDSTSYVVFTNPSHGWVLGHDGAFVTRDGGFTWTPVAEPPKPELVKNVIPLSSGGAVFFRKDALELRDADLRVVRSRSVAGIERIDCLASTGEQSLVLLTRATDREGERRAGALEVRLPSLETVREIPGLPPDFLCSRAAGGAKRAVFTGARLDSAGFWGISHAAYALTGGAAEFQRLAARGRGAAAAVAADGRFVIGHLERRGDGSELRLSRSRAR